MNPMVARKKSTGKKKDVAVVSKNKQSKEEKLKSELASLRAIKQDLEKEGMEQRKKIKELENENKEGAMKWEGKFNKVKVALEELKSQKRGFCCVTVQANKSKFKADLARQELEAEKTINSLETTTNSKRIRLLNSKD